MDKSKKECEIIYKLPVRVNLEKIRALRKEAGMTQQDVAQLLGKSTSTYGMYEQGYRAMTGEILHALAEIFEVTPIELINLPQELSASKYTDGEKHSTILASIDALADNLNQGYNYWYDGLSLETVYKIVTKMRLELKEYFYDLGDKEQVDFVLKFFVSLLSYYNIFPQVITSALVTVLMVGEDLADKRAKYIDTASPREISLLYHVNALVESPEKYMLDDNNLFIEHFTPYVRKLVQYKESFVFPPVSRVRKYADNLMIEQREVNEWLKKRGEDES